MLYNYARLATLFINFGKACERGTNRHAYILACSVNYSSSSVSLCTGIYPPLPGAKEIDFSLLSDKVCIAGSAICKTECVWSIC